MLLRQASDAAHQLELAAQSLVIALTCNENQPIATTKQNSTFVATIISKIYLRDAHVREPYLSQHLKLLRLR